MRENREGLGLEQAIRTRAVKTRQAAQKDLKAMARVISSEFKENENEPKVTYW